MNFNLAVVAGDGIGPEVMAQNILVLNEIGKKFGHTFKYTEVKGGGCAIDEFGEPLPQHTIDVCKASDSVLLGAVGGWQWDTLPGDMRPERALLGLRGALGLYANLRPATLHDALKDAVCTSVKRAESRLIWVRRLTMLSSTPLRKLRELQGLPLK